MTNAPAATVTVAVLAVVIILVRGGYSPLDAVAVAVFAGVGTATVTGQLRAARWHASRGVASA